MKLFQDYDKDVQQVIAGVISVEQEHISYERPRGVKDLIKQIIDRVVKNEI